MLRDRYESRILKGKRDLRSALVYVLQNARKHGARFLGVDPYSSGPWFEGWLDRRAKAGRPIARAGSWILKVGWRERGLIATSESPVGGRGCSWLDVLERDTFRSA